ncbi:esterase family protein [Rhodobacteraceae bacterium NNCM2]|nr:esterase family protein [Coraliihabitans acroporae]
MPSKALGHPVNVTVYQPEGAAPPGGWPVITLLHGLGGNDQDWHKLGNIVETLDRMIGAGEIAPMVAVMPDAASSWYVNSAAIGGPGDYETAIAAELHAWVEETLPVRKDRGGRAIAGLSMGGYGALRLALLHPLRYAAVASLSGAMWQNVPREDFDLPPEQLRLIIDSSYFHFDDPATLETGVVLPPPGGHFNAAYGTPFDAKFFNDQNVFTLLAERLDEGADLPALYVTVGDDDSHKLWRGSIAFYETLKANDHAVELRVTDGDHVWSLWRVSIIDALLFINQHLSLSPEGPKTASE